MDKDIQLERLRSFLKTDRAILIGCIGIAFIIWLFTKLAQSYDNEYIVNVEYLVPERKIIAGKVPKLIPVRVEAGGWELINKYFTSYRPSIKLELDSNKEFQTFSSLQIASQVSRQLKDNIEVNASSIAPISVQVDDRSYKKIPVKLNHSIQLASQFQLSDNIKVIPDSVTVSGPEVIVQQLKYWDTQVLSLNDLNQSQQPSVRLKKHPIETVTFKPDLISCEIKVEQYTEKTLSVPLQVINVPPEMVYLVIPTSVETRFVVGLSDYENVTPDGFVATVDFSRMNPENHEPVEIVMKEIPEKIKNLSFKPLKADFYINK